MKSTVFLPFSQGLQSENGANTVEFYETPDGGKTSIDPIDHPQPSLRKGKTVEQNRVRGSWGSRSSYPRDCTLSANGKPHSNIANALAFIRWKMAGITAYDEMSRQPLLMRALDGSRKFTPRPLRDDDVTRAQEKLQRLGLVGLNHQTTYRALSAYARERSFHPLKDYLNGLAWDGKPRLCGGSYRGEDVEPFAVRYLGAERSEYTTEITKMFWISMAARVFDPGCKADYMLVLEGEQGSRKSTVCQVIGGKYFSDDLPDLRDKKEVSEYLSGHWLVEIPELHRFSAANHRQVKAFLTRSTEVYRRPYAALKDPEPRQCVFVGTTNESTYLYDVTGGRRYWPIKVGKIDVDATRRDRDQLFAEAVALYKKKVPCFPSPEFEETHVVREQEARREVDAWEGPVRDYLTGKTKLRICDIAAGALKIEDRHLGRSDQNRIGNALRSLGWVRGEKKGGHIYWYPKT